MVSKMTKIVNPMGMHMRPAGMFAQEMMKFNSDVVLVFKDKEINAKSIMNLMAACIKCGSELEVRCTGDDEQAALDKAVSLIECGLGEYPAQHTPCGAPVHLLGRGAPDKKPTRGAQKPC